MPWSWKVVRIAGIDVYVHATFLMLVAWIGWSHWNESHHLGAVIEGVGFILALFTCVVMHEFGHALTAARYGIRTRDITLLPIGGVARLERMPDVPLQELWVALAGPAVNVVVAAVLAAWLQVSGAWEAVDGIGVATGAFVERVMLANVLLAAFNLLPAFPMDGGRALRAFLATRMEYTRATQRAATVGQGMAILFGLIGLQRMEHAGQPNCFLRQVAPVKLRSEARRVSFVEDQIQNVKYRPKALCPFLSRRKLKGNSRDLDRLFRPADSLSHRRLGYEKSVRDLGRR